MKTTIALTLLNLMFTVPAVMAEDVRVAVGSTTILAKPGHYVLTRDITVPEGDAIAIESSDVSLDLGTHVVSSTARTGALIRIAAGVTRVSIQGGRLVGGGNGIAHAQGAPRIHLSIEKVEVVRAAGTAINIGAAQDVEIDNCRIRFAGGTGIHVDGASNAFGGKFLGNTIDGTFRYGLHLVGLTSGEVERNVVTGFGKSDNWDSGIVLSGGAEGHLGRNVVKGNAVRISGIGGDSGMTIDSDANTIVDNEVTGVDYDGIIVRSAGNTISGNSVSANGRHGVHVRGEQNRIEGNTIEANGGSGIYFDGKGANSYASNTIWGNSLPGVGGRVGRNVDVADHAAAKSP